jgi:hypothetical protein
MRTRLGTPGLVLVALLAVPGCQDSWLRAPTDGGARDRATETARGELGGADQARPVDTLLTDASRPTEALPVQRNGRWLTYKGLHTSFVGVDAQQLAADPALDFVSVLDQLKAYRINKVRVWVDAYFNLGYLHPWAYHLVIR